MANQLPQEVIEMAQGAARMMIEDGVTFDMFYDGSMGGMDRLARVYIEAYVQRQTRICMTHLTCSGTRGDVLVAILSTLERAQRQSVVNNGARK